MKDENHCPQVFFKKCKYVEKEEKEMRYITDNLEIFSDDSDEECFLNKRSLNFFKLL